MGVQPNVVGHLLDVNLDVAAQFAPSLRCHEVGEVVVAVDAYLAVKRYAARHTNRLAESGPEHWREEVEVVGLGV